MQTQYNEELIFCETVEKVLPLLEKMNESLRASRISLKNQQYRIDNNHLTIIEQEKKIAENKALLDDANSKAKAIISVAEDRAKEIDRGIREKMAEINHLERETKRKSEEADKAIWESRNKKAVKV